MKKTCISALFAGLAVLIVAGGCSSGNVSLKQDKYVPSFSADDFREYKNKSIYLPPFANKADNTTIWYYSSNDKKRRYVMNNVEQFFWNCCQDAFMHVGIFVYESQYPAQTVNADEKLKQGLKEFRLQLSSLTDIEYRFIVTLYDKGSIVFQRKFIIPMTPPESDDRAALEQRAYQMIDKTFKTILKDEGFRDAFLKDSGAAQEPAKGD